MNTYVSHIARQQATMGGFTSYTSLSPLALEDENDDGFDNCDADEASNDDADEDNDASSPNDDEIST